MDKTDLGRINALIKSRLPLSEKDFLVYRSLQYALCEKPPFFFQYVPLTRIVRYCRLHNRDYTVRQVRVAIQHLLDRGLLVRRTIHAKHKRLGTLIKKSYYRFIF